MADFEIISIVGKGTFGKVRLINILISNLGIFSLK